MFKIDKKPQWLKKTEANKINLSYPHENSQASFYI